MSSAVIKTNANATVRPLFALVQPVAAVQVADTVSAEDRVVSNLKEQIAAYEAQIAAHEDALAKTFADGEAAGRAAAEDEYEDDRQQSLCRLEEGIKAAQDSFADALQHFDVLALQLAHEALHVLIGDDAKYKAMLKAAIARQMALIVTNSVVAVEVSRSDFPDSREIEELAARLNLPSNQIRLSEELNAGQCHFDLKIGRAEFDFQQGWQEISKVLAAEDKGAAA